MAVKGIVSLVLAFVVGAVVAAFLAGGRLDDAPSEPVFPTVTATSSARTVATAAEVVTPTDTPIAEVLASRRCSWARWSG